jgi:hypothetical protein
LSSFLVSLPSCEIVLSEVSNVPVRQWHPEAQRRRS